MRTGLFFPLSGMNTDRLFGSKVNEMSPNVKRVRVMNHNSQ